MIGAAGMIVILVGDSTVPVAAMAHLAEIERQHRVVLVVEDEGERRMRGLAAEFKREVEAFEECVVKFRCERDRRREHEIPPVDVPRPAPREPRRRPSGVFGASSHVTRARGPPAAFPGGSVHGRGQNM